MSPCKGCNFGTIQGSISYTLYTIYLEADVVEIVGIGIGIFTKVESDRLSVITECSCFTYCFPFSFEVYITNCLMVYIFSRRIVYLGCGHGCIVSTHFSRELLTIATTNSPRLNPNLIIPSILIPCCGIHHDTAAISLSAFHWLFKPDVLNPDVTNKVSVLKKQKAVIDCAGIVNFHILPFCGKGNCCSGSTAPVSKFAVDISGRRPFYCEGHFVSNVALSRDVIHYNVLNIPRIGIHFGCVHQQAVTNKRGAVAIFCFV